MAYKVRSSDVPEVMAYLDNREKGGYTTRQLSFHPQDRTMSPFVVLAYTATQTSENYVGPALIATIAEHIVHSKGLSGNNTEYVLELARTMREIAPFIHDEHLFTLEAKVKEMMMKTRESLEPETKAQQ